MRVSHWLKTNAKVELPQHLIFVDTETKAAYRENDTDYHKLWFGWALHLRIRQETGHKNPRETWFRFETAGEFWAWVDRMELPRTRLWILAHNWNFDAGILNVSKFLSEPDYKLTKYINDKPPFILSFRHGNSTLLLVDTLNYFAGSLESIGDAIGIPKQSFPGMGDSVAEWDEYCKRDVRVMSSAFLGFRALVETESLGNFQTTLASQAFAAYRHKYMPHPILIHDHEHVSQCEREAYYGGRSECFRLGNYREKLYYLDVNSLYPTVMQTEKYPIEYDRSYYRPSLEEVAEIMKNRAVVARVRIDASEPCYPVRHDGRLVFPIGNIQGYFTSPEIQLALDRGELVSVRWMAAYKQANIFRAFVTDMYALRQKYKSAGNEVFQYLLKILMNSLYGKFGQSGNKWEEVEDVYEWFIGTLLYEDNDTGKVRKLRRRLGVVQEFKRRGESQNSFPAIAAHVTAYGRTYMLRYIQKVGWDNVYYMDTDSLIVNEAGYQTLLPDIHPTKIGRLSLENTSTDTTIWAPKDYRFGDAIRRKGIRKNAHQVRIRTWRQDKFISWDYLASQGLDGYIPIQTIEKTLHRIYKKGNVDEKGKVSPLRFPRLDD